MVDLDQIEKDIDEGRYVDFETLDYELKWDLYMSLVPLVFGVGFVATLLWLFHV